MHGWLNIGSLILGLIAWILPLIGFMKKDKPNQLFLLSMGSLSACAIAICFQLYYQVHLVEIEDWSALMDTTSAAATLSMWLLVGTIVLNGITFITWLKKR